jgi:TIGR03009 family protein
MAHVGRAEPASRVVPFFLNPAEQQELDAFLARWEKYSAGINRYDISFNLFIYDPTIPGAQPNKAYKVAYGYFKYNANPRRFVYEIEGEWIGGNEQIKRDGDKNPQIFAEKVIIDEKSVHQYDYNAKTVRQINVPPELIGKGIADSPLPLIFGAKADDLKRRFSMKIENVSDELIRLYARPLLVEDQQEFRELEILLYRNNLTARALRQWENNGKTYKVFDLQTPTINARTNLIEDLKKWFTADVPRGWKRESMDWIAPSPVSPPPIPAIPQAQVANPQQHNEMPLYRVQ